jgi:glycosyltransferase involved in cell wall biosynthesis
MKIFHLIDSGGFYGAENMLISLATEQIKLGLQPVIGSIRRKGLTAKPLELEARKRGIPLKLFEIRPGPNLVGALGIVHHIKHFQYDVLHSHGYKTNILLGLLPSSFRGAPMISTLHGWTSAGGLTKIRLYVELDAFSLRYVDKIVLVNKGMLGNPKVQRLPIDKICVINNGIEISNIVKKTNTNHKNECIIKQVIRFCDKGKVITSIGRLSEEKGFFYLIEAVRILRQEKGEDVRLLLIGDGKLRNQLEKQARQSGLVDFFFITGYIEKAYQLLQYSDCYVISSLTEGLPISLLEAMASGAPILATAVGGIPHVVTNEKDAILVPPKNPYAIADGVKKILNHKSTSDALASAAKLKVANSFSSKVMAIKYKEVYEQIAN